MTSGTTLEGTQSGRVAQSKPVDFIEGNHFGERHPRLSPKHFPALRLISEVHHESSGYDHVVLSAILHRYTKTRICDRVIISHFATQGEGKQELESGAKVNAAAELRRAGIGVAVRIIRATLEFCAVFIQAVAEAARKPG